MLMNSATQEFQIAKQIESLRNMGSHKKHKKHKSERRERYEGNIKWKIYFRITIYQKT